MRGTDAIEQLRAELRQDILFIENDLGHDEWHKTLVDRMTLDIEGVRPALVDLEFARKIDELRRFRHLFRNLYKTLLIPAKVRLANEFAATLVDDFRIHHDKFDAFLIDLKRELGS